MNSSCGANFSVFPYLPAFDRLPFLIDNLRILFSAVAVVTMNESGVRTREAHISDRFANYLTNGFQKRISEVRCAEKSKHNWGFSTEKFYLHGYYVALV